MIPLKIILIQLRYRMGLLLSLQNLCVSNPCLNNGKCLMGFTNKKYLCVCKTGFTGENCENGKCFINNNFLSAVGILLEFLNINKR